jgi:hypothetical protein
MVAVVVVAVVVVVVLVVLFVVGMLGAVVDTAASSGAPWCSSSTGKDVPLHTGSMAKRGGMVAMVVVVVLVVVMDMVACGFIGLVFLVAGLTVTALPATNTVCDSNRRNSGVSSLNVTNPYNTYKFLA